MLYLTLFEVKRMSYNQSFAAALCLPAQFFVFSLKRGETNKKIEPPF